MLHYGADVRLPYQSIVFNHNTPHNEPVPEKKYIYIALE